MTSVCIPTLIKALEKIDQAHRYLQPPCCLRNLSGKVTGLCCPEHNMHSTSCLATPGSGKTDRQDYPKLVTSGLSASPSLIIYSHSAPVETHRLYHKQNREENNSLCPGSPEQANSTTQCADMRENDQGRAG